MELTVDVIRCHVIDSAARAYYPIDCFQMAPECRLLKLLLKSLKLNRHISIEVETILQFLFSPTLLKSFFGKSYKKKWSSGYATALFQSYLTQK